MPAANTTHPPKNELAAFAVGRLADDRRAEVEAHVAGCGECCAALELADSDGLLGLAREALLATTPPGGVTPFDADTKVPAELIDHPRYRIVGRLGAGGMGVVFKAEHRVMGRMVALKVMSRHTMEKPGAADRFRREVRLASRLSHPNIVTAYDADEADGLHFLVMEYVEGISLDRLVAKRPLSVPMVCQFARQAALGLQHAADKGMVHRDVKPHNLMVTKKGQVKILDFGLACVAHVEGEAATTGTAARMTDPEMVLGTPDFLAPEQARQVAPVDGRADLYALGCTLYYLLTGKPPFGGSTGMEKLIAHVQDPAPDVTADRPDVPPGLAAVIAKLMAKDPAARYQTPGEVAAALAPFVRSGAETPNPGQVLAAIPMAEPVVPAAETVATFDDLVATPSDTRVPAPHRARLRPTRRKRASFTRAHVGMLIAAAAAVLMVAGGAYVGWKVLSPPTRPTGGVAANTQPTGTKAQPAGRPDRPAVAADAPTILLVLPPVGLYYKDYGPLRDALERGMAVRTATRGKRPSKRHDLTPGDDVPADLALESVDPNQFVGVIFIGAGVEEYLPGGKSAAAIRRLIDGMVTADKRVIAAICLGQQVLAEHGYLDGKLAARCPLYKNPPKAVNWTDDRPIVIASRFVTARTDEQADGLGRLIVEHVAKLGKP